MRTLLLDKTTAPLNRLALHRIQLEQASPHEILEMDGAEGLLYALVGQARVTVDGVPLGVLGGRRSVTERLIHAARVPAGVAGQLSVTLEGYAADLLWVTCDAQRVAGKKGRQAPEDMSRSLVHLHWNDAVCHDVGTGCYRRTVAEVSTPSGYELHCGETLSDGTEGVWSSWPSHAAPEDMERYAEHEEVFFPLTSGSFLMREEGRYCTGDIARGVRELHNGAALVTPLGSHELCVSPGDVGYYAWFYLSFLKKQYNKYSDQHMAKVYVK